MSSKKSSEHPIERAESAIATEPLLAVDIALLAFGQTRGHRSTWETNHYYDVLAERSAGQADSALLLRERDSA